MPKQSQPQPLTASADSEAATLRAECERLRARVRELEQLHDCDQAKLAESQRALFAVVQQMFSDKDLCITADELRNLTDGKDGLPLEAFIGELEQIAKGR